jgi:hypothetical protein
LSERSESERPQSGSEERAERRGPRHEEYERIAGDRGMKRTSGAPGTEA